MANKATDDEARSQSVDLEEVFVSESGMLADAEDGEYVGIPAKAFEPRQTFEGITIDDSNKMKDVEGEEIGTYSDQLTGKVSEEELAAPRALLHLRGTDDSAQQDIELNDFRAVVRSGAVLNSDGDYVWTAENSDSGHSFTYRIFYAFSGVGEYAEDQIHITIPKSILRDRDGNFADSYELPIPEYTEDDLTASNLFVYKEVGENLVIFNRLSCSAAQSGFIEVSYTTTKPTFDYADYLSEDARNEKGGSDPFQATIAIDNGSAQCSRETQKVPVYIDTTATLRKVKKWNPYSAYTEWNNAWGNTVKPDNPDDYEYLIWTIDMEANATQPYNLTFSDTFNEKDAMLLGYRDSGADEKTYQRSLTITNSRSKYMTVYVLTAHKKSTYNELLEQNGRYSLNNSVSVTLQPADEVDSPSTLTSRAAYYKEAPRFKHPSGHFYSTKNGYDVSDRYVRNSDYIRDYSLLEFNQDDNATIGNLKYYTDVYGYAYPWTLPDDVTLDQAAADPGIYYGKNPVTYTLSDNTFYLKEISNEEYSEKLTAADYELEYIQMDIYEEVATYNQDTMQFDKRTLSTYSPTDVIKIYAEAGGSGNYVHVADYKLKSRTYEYTADADTIVDKAKTAKTSGMNVYFKGNVTGYRLETTNAYWYTKLGAYPYVKLKHSDTVDKYARSAIGGNRVSKLCLKNTSASKISQSNRTIISFTRSADDYITGKNKRSLLEKSFVGATNSAKKREYTVTWNVSMSESYRDNEGTYLIPQQSGVFYDLLPDGAVYKKDSLSVYAGSTKLESWKYTVTVDDNYRGSGRTMLKIAINESADSYRLVYSTVHPWEAIVDYGTKLLNTVAYETGNSSITDGKTSSQTQDITESELMKDLDQSGDSKRFLYTEYAHDASLLVATNLGLEKKVRGTDDTSYSQSAVTYKDNNYYYNVRFATDDHSKASELIAFDSLENYVVVSGKDAGQKSKWHGIFQGVDTHQLERLGIAPKVYYSRIPGLIIKDNENDNTNLADTSVWTPSDSFAGDLSSVKAIAVDMRTAADGSPYEMPVDTGAQFTVYMRAPHGIESDEESDEDEIPPRAFNNIYLNNNTINVETGDASGERLIHQDYTEITLKIVADLELLKVSSEDDNVVVPGIKFNLSGTSDYGTKVNETLYTDAEGKITRRNLEKGTYTLKETETNSDFFLNDTVFTVTVNMNGDLTINGSTEVKPYVIKNPPRVHGDLEFLKKVNIDGTTDTAPLTGAEFKLEGVSNYGNSVLKYGTSQNGGVVTITDIEWGTYKLTETKTADGYIISTEEYSVVCDKYGIVTLYRIEDGSPVEVKPTENGYSVIVNEPLHNFRLVKYDPLNNALLSGAEFTLKGTSDYGTPVDMTAVSAADLAEEGIATFKGLEPGHYTLQETKAPEHYQLDSTVRTVTVSSAGEITVSGLTKRPSDWHSGLYADCFGVPNTREYEGEITITKLWRDADGNPITDSSDLPIPVVHVDTEEPVISIPKPDAYVQSGITLRNRLRNATTFQKTTKSYTRSTLPENAERVDDGRTRAAIFVWLEGTDAYWWSDASAAHLPDKCNDLFYYNKSLKTVDLSGFDTSNVTDMSYMFSYCSNLTTLDVSGFDTGSVTDMRNMFYDCYRLTTLDLSGFDTGSVTNMSYMFYACTSLHNLDVSGWNTGSVTDMRSMFNNCSNLTTLDVSGFVTGSVTDMSQMFFNCKKLTTLDVSGFVTGSVTDMNNMFVYCQSLTTLDVSGWDTGSVTDMNRMFSSCSNLTTLDVRGFDTGSVTNMSFMFSSCSNLTTLDVSGFDTGSVTDMSDMFWDCYSLTTLDLSGFDTGKVTDMSYMFDSCSNLKTVYVGDLWSTAKVTSSTSMFYGCNALKGGAGTTYKSYYTYKIYARIDNPPDEPGYFTYKYVPPTGNKDDEPLGVLMNVFTGLISDLTDAVFGDSSAENSQAAPEIQTVKKPEMLAAGRPDISAAIDFKSDIALGDPGDSDTNTNTVTFSQITNSEVTSNSDDAEGKWLDNRDGTWTYKMKVFNVPATYYIWEEPIPGFKCDLDNSTGYTVINYPRQNSATITNTRTTTDTCSLTLKKVLEGNASDYPEYDLAGMDYHFNVKLTGDGVAGKKIFGYTKFTNGEATVTLKAGEQITFTNIPRGVTYTVTEQEENYQGVFDTTYSPSGTLTENNSDVTFTVTNNIKPKKSLNIKKTVLPYDGGELDDEDRARVFTFNVDLHADINGLYGELIFAGGKATAYLKHGETVRITGLPDTVGSYTVTEAESALYTCDQPTQSGELIGKETSIEFKNTKIPEEERDTGSFTLKKLINGKTTTDNEFAFNIALSKLDKNAVYTLSDGTQFTTDQNGTVNLTLTLKHGDSVTFSDLPVGAEYTVSEQACNYTASYAITGTERVVPLSAENTETDKQLTTSKITVQKDDDITITYTNTDKRYDVRIAKVDEDDEFVTDAVLQIIEKGNEENVLDEWVTTEDYHTAQIPQGTYILREKQAPFGYMKAPDIEFTVNADGTITSGGENVLMLKMVDKPIVLAVTGAVGVIPVVIAATSSFILLLTAVVIKNRKKSIKEKRSTTK
ncbi:BspA family leucine-rich repeat surface protein [Ruminococcus sp. JL13D9]|uniref:BspA family leucine-rich repeat surface protein n=1 Tax=Ruminococcus sp. JL13D9 TaxID=3233381 RepID=UPI003899E7DA